MKKRGFMRVPNAKILLLFIAISFFTSGCVDNNVDITFDNHDNMIVRTELSYSEKVNEYIPIEDLEPTKLQDTYNVKAERLNVETTFEPLKRNGVLGHYQIEKCSHISWAKNISRISIIEPQYENGNVLEVKHFIFFKKYSFRGKVVPPQKLIRNFREHDEHNYYENPENFIDSCITIEIPQNAKSIHTNASINGNEKSNYYHWIASTKDDLIVMEFITICWFSIIISILLLIVITYYVICKRIRLNWRQVLFGLSKTLQKLSQTENTEKQTRLNLTEEQKIKTVTNTRKTVNVKIISCIVIPIVIVLGIMFYFSIPKICELLIQNSIQSIYSGHTNKAIEFVRIAKTLSPNKDFSTEIYAKGIDEFTKNNISNGESFMKMTLKLEPTKKKEYSKQLVDKSLSTLQAKQYKKACKLMEYALQFDEEIPQKKVGDLRKKVQNSYLAKKYEEALAYANLTIIIEPNNEKNYALKGMCLRGLNRTKEAIEAYTKAINIDNNFSSAFLSRGYIYQQTKELDKAYYDLNKVLQYSQNQSEIAFARLYLSNVAFERGQYRNAIENARIAMELFRILGNSQMEELSYQAYDKAIDYDCWNGGYCP